MRVLYLSRTYTTHDRRFLEAIGGVHEVGFAQLEDDGVRYETRPLPPGVVPIEWAGGQEPVLSYDSLLALGRDFERVVEEWDADLIHAGPVPTSAFLAALVGRRPLVAMSWGSDLLVDAERSSAAGWASRFALQRAEGFVCDALAVRQKARALAGGSVDRTVQFPWGIDTRRYSPGSPSSDLRSALGWETNCIVVSNRTWASGYGIETVVRSFARAYRSRPELRLLLAGDGPLAPDVDRAIHDERIDQAVHRVGRVSQERLPDLLRVSDIYLSCSESDGSSISLLEAMGVGLPVVVTDAPGNREWVSDGHTGHFAGAGDAEGFAGALVSLVDTGPEARRAMGAAGRRTVVERADWAANVPRLLDAYEQIVGGAL